MTDVIGIEDYQDLNQNINKPTYNNYKIGDTITVMTDNQQGTFNVTVINKNGVKALSAPKYWTHYNSDLDLSSDEEEKEVVEDKEGAKGKKKKRKTRRRKSKKRKSKKRKSKKRKSKRSKKR